jgi:hypothetical protein
MSNPGVKRQLGRRGAIGAVGAGALTASSAVFGASRAEALVNVECCHLFFQPTVTLTNCLNHQYHYVWACQTSPTRGCQCCEKENAAGDAYASAYACEHV